MATCAPDQILEHPSVYLKGDCFFGTDGHVYRNSFMVHIICYKLWRDSLEHYTVPVLLTQVNVKLHEEFSICIKLVNK